MLTGIGTVLAMSLREAVTTCESAISHDKRDLNVILEAKAQIVHAEAELAQPFEVVRRWRRRDRDRAARLPPNRPRRRRLPRRLCRQPDALHRPLAPRPGRIQAIMRIDFPRPRPSSLKRHAAFVQLTEHIWQLLQRYPLSEPTGRQEL